MSRATVRAKLTAFLAAGCDPVTGSVPGVNAVYKAQPWLINGSSWNLKDELGSGSVIFLHFPDKDERRLSDPAAGITPGVVGWKQKDFQVAVVILYQFLIPSGSQAGGLDGTQWVDPLDATIDALEALIRSDPRAGTGPVEDGGDGSGVIFQMAQDDPDLSLPQELPRILPGKVLSWQSLHFNVTEVIQA